MIQYKVLLIEDNKMLRENTAEILSFANYDVITASDGKEGVKLAKKVKPDVIVCDIMLPKLDGYGVFHIISQNEETNRIPFIFLTSKGTREDIRRGMGLGVDDYITKPFEGYELLKSVETRIKKSNRVKSISEVIEQSSGEDLFETLEELIAYLLNREAHPYKKGETVFCEGNYSNCMYLIKKGVVKTHKLSENGKELITGFHFENQFFGYTSLMAHCAHTENALAVEDAKLIKIDKEEIEELLESNPHLSLEFLELIANNYKDVKERMLHMAYDSVRGRIAKTLLMLNDIDCGVSLSRADLANLTGIAKETLIRTLTEFKDAKLIEVDKKSFKILKKNELDKIQ
ncbi:MAG: transcriptional regulator [Flavobacteriia bacterium]|nr:MAG: transcriptional regulator [Flavobacteriia bacterium]